MTNSFNKTVYTSVEERPRASYQLQGAQLQSFFRAELPGAQLPQS